MLFFTKMTSEWESSLANVIEDYVQHSHEKKRMGWIEEIEKVFIKCPVVSLKYRQQTFCNLIKKYKHPDLDSKALHDRLVTLPFAELFREYVQLTEEFAPYEEEILVQEYAKLPADYRRGFPYWFLLNEITKMQQV